MLFNIRTYVCAAVLSAMVCGDVIEATSPQYALRSMTPVGKVATTFVSLNNTLDYEFGLIETNIDAALKQLRIDAAPSIKVRQLHSCLEVLSGQIKFWRNQFAESKGNADDNKIANVNACLYLSAVAYREQLLFLKTFSEYKWPEEVRNNLAKIYEYAYSLIPKEALESLYAVNTEYMKHLKSCYTKE